METQENRLKILRKEKGFTQAKLANEIGVSKRTIIAWENDERQIKSDKAQKLADFFEVPIGYLLGYSDYKDMDSYFESIEESKELDVDILNSIDTIGEKNLPTVMEYFKKEFIKEYSQIEQLKNGESIDGWNREDSVSVAMRNVLENLWGLPDSVVKLLLFWGTLKDNEREELYKLIEILAFNNLSNSQD